ncbi:sensor histidine kinase [Actinoplanes sp. CA-030573]|uniref:sensor histidine kinase n=1 Tax=Actinoplanes sp. CA-030573 TaxID=3239898 RepID=UPI003D925616
MIPPVVEALAQSVDTGLLLVSGDVVVSVNREFLRLFGAPESERLVGERVEALACREPFGAAVELWREPHEAYGKRRRSRLPGDRVVEGRWHPLPSDGSPLLVAVVTDLTRQIRIREGLRRHNRALAEVVATKTELVTAMLHELRTPLAAALAMLDLLPASTGDELLDDALPLIGRNVRRIDEVTAEIATVTGIENGTIPLQLAEFDLPELLGVDGSGTILGDRRRLAQVFERLGAAVRALGGEGGTIVAERAGDQWRIGFPLPGQYATDKLFTGANATALMLARAVAGRHGGSVGVESEDGTPRLTVRLPAGGPV